MYATSIVDKYIDNTTVNKSMKFYKTTLTSDIILTKDDVSTSDDKVHNLTRELNIHYIDCIGSFIICYLQEYI